MGFLFQVLYVSPERFLNAEFLSIFSATLSISLVVVDEAHCISEWLVVSLSLSWLDFILPSPEAMREISVYAYLGSEHVDRSHNFRPSYMRLRASLLQARLNVECVLAMTATATTTTLHDVMSALEIPTGNLIQKAQLRDNLQLSVSLSGNNRQVMLLAFLPLGFYLVWQIQ